MPSGYEQSDDYGSLPPFDPNRIGPVLFLILLPEIVVLLLRPYW
jgi:hypothetical protein